MKKKNDLKHIELILENCEVVYVEPKYARIIVKEICKIHMFNCFANERNHEFLENLCDFCIFIEEPSKALTLGTFGEQDQNPIDRLIKHKDICHIAFVYFNKKLNKTFAVRWGDKADEYNDPEMTIELVNGELHISSAKYQE